MACSFCECIMPRAAVMTLVAETFTVIPCTREAEWLGLSAQVFYAFEAKKRYF